MKKKNKPGFLEKLYKKAISAEIVSLIMVFFLQKTSFIV